jgi:hypothetical protein
MHVLQWIAIKDESLEDALAHVRNNLESYMESGMWYDWFVVGGGRWNIEENEDWRTGYDEKTNMIISAYEAGNDVFIDKINSCIESRIREFNDYRKQYEEKALDISAKLDSYDGSMDFSFDLYPMGKMIDMLQGEWDFNSYFFDMDAHSTNTKYVLDKLEASNVNWYLVPVDFHF